MSVCEDSDRINVTEKAHNLCLSGLFLGKAPVLLVAKIGVNAEYGCVSRIVVRSKNAAAANYMSKCINK